MARHAVSQHRRHEMHAVYGMIAPAVVLVTLFLIVPFLLAFVLSFTNERLIPRPIPTSFVGVRNYERVLVDEDFWQAFWNTFRFAFFVVPIQSGIALGLALLIDSKLPGRNVFRGIFFTPTVITMVVVAIIWAGLFRAPEGLLNSIVTFVSFGQAGPYDWLLDTRFALPMIMVMSIWQGAGFQMIIYLAGLQGINREMYEAARIDGAGRWQQFWYITMPALRNTHIFVLVTTTILAFKLFAQIEVLTQGRPLGTTNTLVRYIYALGFKQQKVGLAAAAAVIFFVIVLAIAMVQRRLIREERAV